MTISTTTRTVTHNGNGVAVNFTYPFKIADQVDLLVYLKSGSVFILKSLGTDYTVSGVGSPSGGTVSFTAVPAVGTGNVRFLRRTALTQLVDYITNDDFPAEIHEAALDKLTMAVQDYLGDSLTLDATGDFWDAESRVIKNVADPVDAQDAATKVYGETNWGGAAAASAAASASAAAGSASAASTSASAAAVSAAALPNATGNANTVPVVNGTGNGWLMKTAAQMLTFLGLGVVNQASGVVVLDSSSKLPAVDGSQLTGIQGQQAGEVCYFARNTAPTGFLKANGAAVSRTTYDALFSAIGTAFGTGDGATTFNIPDLRGEFVRGWDDACGIDAGRGIGTWQDSDNKSHTHKFRGGSSSNGGTIYNAQYGGGGSGYTIEATGSIVSAGGGEARPRNVALLACIKY